MYGITDLAKQIDDAQAMYESAATAKDFKLARDLLTTLGSLKKSQRIYLEKSGQMVDREVLVRIGNKIGDFVADALEGVPGFEDRLDNLRARIDAELLPARIAPPQI